MARPALPLAVALATLVTACATPGALVMPQLPTNVPDPGPRERIRVVTYNLHWHRIEPGPRSAAILAELMAADADVIALQEVGTWFAEALAASGFCQAGGYAATSIEGETLAPSRLLLLTRFPVRSTLVKRLVRGERSVVITKLQVNGRPIAVANVHLSSRLTQKKLRTEQLREVLSLLGDDEAILLGDFNFGDGDEPESSTIPASFVDSWRKVNAGDPGLTWNREANTWANRNSYDGEPSRRIDRILIRSSRLEPEEARMLGLAPAPFADGRHPSDHFGVVTTIRDAGPTIPAPRDL